MKQWDPSWTGPARQALLRNGFEPIPLNGKVPVLGNGNTCGLRQRMLLRGKHFPRLDQHRHSHSADASG